MTRGLADTSVFIARESGRPIRAERLPDELAVSVITVGELRAGVLAAEEIATRDRRLTTLTEVLRLRPLLSTERSPTSGPSVWRCVTPSGGCR